MMKICTTHFLIFFWLLWLQAVIDQFPISEGSFCPLFYPLCFWSLKELGEAFCMFCKRSLTSKELRTFPLFPNSSLSLLIVILYMYYQINFMQLLSLQCAFIDMFQEIIIIGFFFKLQQLIIFHNNTNKIITFLLFFLIEKLIISKFLIK